jgi:hypothetical protein
MPVCRNNGEPGGPHQHTRAHTHAHTHEVISRCAVLVTAHVHQSQSVNIIRLANHTHREPCKHITIRGRQQLSRGVVIPARVPVPRIRQLQQPISEEVCGTVCERAEPSREGPSRVRACVYSGVPSHRIQGANKTGCSHRIVRSATRATHTTREKCLLPCPPERLPN